VIVVKTSNASEYSVGESVVVALQRQSMALVSVVWGYVVPLVVLLAVLFGSVSLGLSDGIAALSTILAVVIYYVGLYVARRVFERKIEFTIFKE
jgi:positive regulator of sigma E activity